MLKYHNMRTLKVNDPHKASKNLLKKVSQPPNASVTTQRGRHLPPETSAKVALFLSPSRWDTAGTK